MNKKIFLLFLIIALAQSLIAQKTKGKLPYDTVDVGGTKPNTVKYDGVLRTIKGKVISDVVITDSAQYIPLRDTTFTPEKIGALTLRPQDLTLYIATSVSPIVKKWQKTVTLDTASLSNRINLKVDSVKKSHDSVFFYRNGTKVYAYKDSNYVANLPLLIDESTKTISINLADSNNDGYLSALKYISFVNKENVLTFNSPLSRSVNAISIPQATSGVSGYLLNTNWSTFNNKWGPAGNTATTGDWFGTLNAEPILFKTNNTQVGSISADGLYKILLGYKGAMVGATGSYSIALNYEPIASGNYSFASGYQCVATGLAATAMSRNSQAVGNYSFAAGSYPIASGIGSAAFCNAEVRGDYALGWGKNNEIATDANDRLLVVGWGSATNDRHNAWTGLTNGNLGWFDILAPTARIHLPAGTSTAGTQPIKFTLAGADTLATRERGAIQPKGDRIYYDDSSLNKQSFAFLSDLPTSSTYTPTLTNVANVSASTAYSCQYYRVGNAVTVSGEVDIDPTTTITLTQLGISLPIASAIANSNELAGTAADELGDTGRVAGDATNDRAEIRLTPVDVTNRRFSFSFTYRIL